MKLAIEEWRWVSNDATDTRRRTEARTQSCAEGKPNLDKRTASATLACADRRQDGLGPRRHPLKYLPRQQKVVLNQRSGEEPLVRGLARLLVGRSVVLPLVSGGGLGNAPATTSTAVSLDSHHQRLAWVEKERKGGLEEQELATMAVPTGEGEAVAESTRGKEEVGKCLSPPSLYPIGKPRQRLWQVDNCPISFAVSHYARCGRGDPGIIIMMQRSKRNRLAISLSLRQ
ncbi:hypothetical protein CFC21_018828 [Triticum aestivum]|uniref:Uncharacterized protein n=2 Tax=Triticum aestivum TaxID=4565 RepID=A0A9R1E4A0_WHEAT|nr:hypothetical protein CFC21_018828 [Triticum aestivum]